MICNAVPFLVTPSYTLHPVEGQEVFLKNFLGCAMDQTLQFVIPALMGVESTVAWELKKLGLSNRSEERRVGKECRL